MNKFSNELSQIVCSLNEFSQIVCFSERHDLVVMRLLLFPISLPEAQKQRVQHEGEDSSKGAESACSPIFLIILHLFEP